MAGPDGPWRNRPVWPADLPDRGRLITRDTARPVRTNAGASCTGQRGAATHHPIRRRYLSMPAAQLPRTRRHRRTLTVTAALAAVATAAGPTAPGRRVLPRRGRPPLLRGGPA